MAFIQGNPLAVAKDVAEGYVFVTPIFLKKFVESDYKELYHNLIKVQKLVRAESPDPRDHHAVRQRNMRLQRLNNSLVVLKHQCKVKKILL
ncbi:MAG: hypothetical protein CO150_02590 [Nitrospirae bacterium CG_4_9_14_3_um_filter_53_35]|nr:MAG: hypothetical protein AUK29_10350 [Nitrospirae bacterium CG2_30_53_67]PIS38330.1 MAG: hypothetical protein COT35_01330 [Nitrospirae bacterium CG08_land_8_20_14_0_20_52_24]PIV85490.1 MAG: hypothetical protein COW52_01980 [Nitrospirae bacterium CG17_big_fil_post_rev_8_21_14_2_50_50_9]PIW85207.1 MAG: hypothetical protein COZ95_05835 [Nitrospirae bacterium CG_4_8_14_3_um_filter_50_41]PIX84523.1 MAG: hypothetical protein COZ32_13215 [Nitrospirae bacterium CG_4_10_14_3_um_filter_53_41]PJA7676